MTRQTRLRIFSLLVLLGALVGILAAPVPNAYAAPCCSSCENTENACLAGTVYTACNRDPECCFNKVANCYRWCSFSC
jgi:hypothetical protein